MKRIFTLIMLCVLSVMIVQAQVAFLQRVADVASYPSEEGEQPEKQAYDWFKTAYVDQSKGAVISMSDVLTVSPATYPVLWINVDAVGLENLSAAGFNSEVVAAIKAYVQAGGNLLLTKQASSLVYLMNRIDYAPSWGNGGYNVGGDVWTVNAQLGIWPDISQKFDSRVHPVFEDLAVDATSRAYTYNGVSYTYETYPLIGTVKRTDNNIMWTDLLRKDGAGETHYDNGNPQRLKDFQNDWSCQVLAVWGHVVDFCGPTIIEFYPQGDFKGSIISIGAAAYQWGASNDYISNIQKLTANALAHLNHNGVEYGYMLPYSLGEVNSIESLHPDYQSAKWFYDNYVKTEKGRFIHRGETIPSGMKVLWVNNDRVGQSSADFYSDFGSDDFRDKLSAFVAAGGKVLLTKQATRLVNDINRCSWAPSYYNESYRDEASDTWYMTTNFVGVGVDRHEHAAFRYMTGYAEHESEGYCKWPLVTGDAPYTRTDHKYMWGEPGEVWNNTYGISAGSTDRARMTAFEEAQTARILGGWGHTTALDGAGLVEFLPTSSFAGTIVAIGIAAYQWTSSNTCANVQNLTKGTLEYLHDADTYTRSVTNGNYGTICLQRASSAFEGAEFYSIAGKELEGSEPVNIVIEKVEALEAGKPYVFLANAGTLTISLSGAAVNTAATDNGLVGSFDIASIADEDDNYILSDNTLYRVNNSKVGANRAYFDLSAMDEYDPSSPAPVRRMAINRPSMPTDVKSVLNTGNVQKRIENGTLYIIREGVKYNVQGQIVH